MASTDSRPSTMLEPHVPGSLKTFTLYREAQQNDCRLVTTIESHEALKDWLQTALLRVDSEWTNASRCCIKLAIMDNVMNSSTQPQLLELLKLLGCGSMAHSAHEAYYIHNYPPSLEEFMTRTQEDRTIIQSAAGFCGGIAWRYCPKSLTTIGIVWVNEIFARALTAHILDGLQAQRALLHHPSLPALLFLQTMLDRENISANALRTDIIRAQLKSGFHRYTYIGEFPAINDDIGKMSTWACGIATGLALGEISLRSLRRYGLYIVEQTNVPTAHHVAVPQTQAQCAREFIRHSANFLIEACDREVEKVNCSSKQVAIIIQGLFHQITQLDATSSIAIAKESKLLAEQGQKLADDTRRLAEYTRKDGLSMKAIAALTMFFLPGTFVATFLSMPFFELNPQTYTLGSHQSWLYWTITIPLTILTVFIWRIWNYFSRDRPLVPEQIEEKEKMV